MPKDPPVDPTAPSSHVIARLAKQAVAIRTHKSILRLPLPPEGWVPAGWLCPFGVPGIFLADQSAASATDPGTRLCSAASATGSAEQRGPCRNEGGAAFACLSKLVHTPQVCVCF